MEETDYSVIIDGYEVNGWIEENQKCKMCKFNFVYHEMYDAYFCPNCNEWAESKCNDKNCKYCANRPHHPLPIK